MNARTGHRGHGHWLHAGASAALALLTGIAAAQAHPLDGLTGAEMSATVEILKAEGKIGDAARSR